MIKILAIDDNSDNLISLRAIVVNAFPDSALYTALDGPAGIELAGSMDPDVILLDIIMPNMDGFEVCRRLKILETTSDIPVVFLTSLNGDKCNRIKALEVGAEAFLSKPIDETELIAQIRAMSIIKSAYRLKRQEREQLASLVEERTRELQRSNEMITKLAEQVPGVVYQYRLYQNGHSCFPYSSPGMIDIYGYTPEEVREDASPVFGRLHPDDFDEIVSTIQESARTLALYHIEFRVILPELGVRWRMCDAKPERMEDGSTLWYGIISDITDRKVAENQLRESEFFFKESQRAAFVGSYRFDLQTNYWSSSEILEQIFGIDKNYIRSLEGWLDLTHPGDREMMERYFREEVVGKRLPFNKEYRIVRKTDGVVRWVLGLGKLSINKEDQVVSMTGTIQDITERVQVLEELHDNEVKYRELFEANADSIAIFLIEGDLISKFLDCNENNAKLLGYTKEEIFKLTPLQIEVPVPEDQLLQRKMELITKGQADFETKLIHKTGYLIDVEIKAKLVRYNNQMAIMNISRDITKRKQQEESLRQSNELNQSLLQTVPFGMDIVDEEGNVLFLSENLSNNFGKGAIGQKCWNLYRDDQCQCGSCPLLRGIQIGATELYETEGVLGGRTFQISHTGMMFQGKKAMLEIFQDISEKREVEKRVKLLAHSLESISECVTVTDNNDLIIYVNKSFLNTYGYEEYELIGKPTSILRPTDVAVSHVRDILPETIEGGWRGEIINMKKDGTLFPILLSTSIIKDDEGKQLALIGVALDITEMKKHRLELIAAKEQAEESNLLKTAFLNNMSHEIRTPMNHIMGFSSLMAEATPGDKDAYAGIIMKSSNQLLTLIENVILLSRLQSEKAKINNISFRPQELILATMSSLPKEELNKNTINSQIPAIHQNLAILSDREKIRQILGYLISNALKYTKGGEIELGFEVNSDRITFYVKDNGIGIPSEEHEKIFDSFYRGEKAVSLVIGGTGLGLSIVRELVQVLNGTIGLESEPGIGSRFYFTLPFEKAVQPKSEQPMTTALNQKTRGMSLLVADDEDINFRYLELLLKNSLLKIDHASNGKEAVEMAGRTSYDMILMDMKMPVMDGFEATRKLKQDFPNLTIIAQTAFATQEDIEKTMLAGCDDFLAKPIRKDALLAMLQKYN